MKRAKLANFLIGTPTFVWLVVFYALPVLIMFLLAFKPVDANGGIGDGCHRGRAYHAPGED